jgi:predicted nucleic-acid-binding Zn-ribbon protein
MSDKQFMERSAICPKCSSKMNALDVACTLPTLFDINNPDAPRSANPKRGFPLDVYHCPKCQYVELYAGEA